MRVDPDPHTARRLLGLLARLAVTALLLLWLFHQAGGLKPVWRAMQAARLESVAAAFLLTVGVQAVIAHRLRLLAHAQGVPLRTREVMDINLVTLFYGLFLPGGGIAAILIRLYRLTRTDRRYTAILAAVLCERLLATATLCLIGLLFWLLDGRERLPQALIVLGAASVPAALALWPMFHPAPSRWVGRLTSRLPLARTLWPRLAEAFASFRAIPLRGKLGLAALSLGAHLLGTGAYFLLAGGLGLKVPFMTLGWMRSTAMVIALLPFSVSGLGLREGTMVALLGQRGVPGHAALAYSMLVFGVTILSVALIGGLFEAIRWLRPRRRN
ncbi:MAG TPA: lysylphosphatidylglycerol synthase transmembrane domain-containing protein [Candidatus Polarisedimenticolaceae bacterium]|nr:lysylphosphatidylglycerol synthase transmembrane domain-containing protein [Candidatus Polarisedimenticolaceae bacterium]